MKRLIRKIVADDDCGGNAPLGLIFKDFDTTITNKDKITDITYGPSLSCQVPSDKDIDNPEWLMRKDFHEPQ